MDNTTTPTSELETPVIETPTPNEQPAQAQAAEPAATTPPEAESQAQPKPEDTLEYWKQRYGESSKEYQIIQAKLNDKEQLLQKLTTPANPTEEQLRREFPDWDTMLPHERKLAQDNLSLRQSLEQTRLETMTLSAERKWEKDFNQALKSYPALKGQEDQFQAFALKPTHKGVDVTVLAQAFLYGSQAPAAPSSPPSSPTGERSTGAPLNKGKSGKLSIEEARTLRNSNYQEYLAQVKAGNLDDEL